MKLTFSRKTTYLRTAAFAINALRAAAFAGTIVDVLCDDNDPNAVPLPVNGKKFEWFGPPMPARVKLLMSFSTSLYNSSFHRMGRHMIMNSVHISISS